MHGLGPAELRAAACARSIAIGRADAHAPGRSMPDDRILLERLNGGVVHAGEVVVGFVVEPHVVEAEPEILALRLTALRRAVRSLGRTALRLAPAHLRRHRRLAAFDADLV